MPKEFTHFALALTLQNAIPDTSSFFSAVQKYPFLFRLGAVAPDIHFFYLLGPDATKVQALSAPFHQPDQRAALPVFKFIQRAGLSRDPEFRDAGLALGAGVICHIMTDTQFHPLVSYYAGMGGLHPGATARHRQFETAMDLYVRHRYSDELGDMLKIRDLVAALEISRPLLNRLLTALFPPRNLGKTPSLTALKWFGRIQHLFCASWVRKSVAMLKKMKLPLPDKVTGLVYPFGHPVNLPFFSGPLTFLDPCTGKKEKTTLSQMIRAVVTDSLDLMETVDAHLVCGKTDLETLLTHPGLPRIRPDLPQKSFTYWYETQDLVNMVYKANSPPF